MITTKDELKKIFEAQDIIRRLWANTRSLPLEKALKELDIEISKLINEMSEPKQVYSHESKCEFEFQREN